ncbi:MAG TPA: hemolysin III family protein [Gaiellaceae bacterium]|jgi:hemolysin III|nr:hemolysin III family protein [Gaiellaceae bacterium]
MDVELRPRLRGVSHQYAFFVSLVFGALLVAVADGAGRRVAAAVFAFGLATMFGVSALYHRVEWQPRARRRMRRLDHAAIYLLIAATYTTFALLALEGAWRWTILPIAWGGAVAAIALKLAWTQAPKWLAAAIALGLGWVGVVALPQLWSHTGPAGVALLAIGGVLYTAGAVIYARQRPDPVPMVFGYHELFHALVIAAAACQYVAVALSVA